MRFLFKCKSSQTLLDSLSTDTPPAAFQCTVSTNHPVKVKGLQNVLEALKHFKLDATNFCLYFAVPMDIFHDFRKQKVLSSFYSNSLTSSSHAVARHPLQFHDMLLI